MNVEPEPGLRPGLIFTMRYASDIGYVWNSMARIYDAAAEVLAPATRCYLAYPRLTANPAYEPRALEPVEGDFYDTNAANRPRLAALMAAHDVRVVFFMGCAPSEISLRFFRRRGVRTINGEHNAIPTDACQGPLKRVAKRLLRGRLHHNIHDAYVANSEPQRRFLLAFAGLPPERVYTVPNGIDTDRFRPGPAPAPEAYGLPRTAHFALTVCQARAEKRIGFLLAAAARVFQLRPAASLTFVHAGDGPCLDDWRTQAGALGLRDRFRFLGFQKDVAPLHRLASLLVHSCHEESFGLALAEAMATGRPVVATDAPGPRELIVPGETGYLTGRDDVDGFAAAVLQLIDEPDVCARLGNAARRHILNSYSVQKRAEELAGVLRGQLEYARVPTAEPVRLGH